jgi:glucose/arabinose dehydrogenase/PKD repeat protein
MASHSHRSHSDTTPSIRGLARLVLALAPAFAPPLAFSALPAGFEERFVADVPAPTALAQLPDGRVLVTSQDGRLWTVQVTPGGGTRQLALDLSSRVCDDSERGLLGVDVDPDFDANGRIYLYSTFRNRPGCPGQDPESPVNRVSRFRFQGAVVDPASEVVLLDGIPSYNGNHNGGDVLIGGDGMLYVSIGDGGCDFRNDSGCAGANDAARDRNTLLGKIARITRDGEVPADNPFVGANTARCNQGNSAAGTICRETWAWGLRNPFRIAADPDSGGTRIFVNDVGQGDWEEVDELQRGADYGWNQREGRCRNGSQSDCPPPPSNLTDPIHAYSHNTGCGSITGGAFVPDGAWPAAFDTAYLYADFGCNQIFAMRQVSANNWTAQTFGTNLGGGGPVALKFLRGPGDAAARDLFYTTYDGGGELRRIVSTAGNGRPTARLQVTPIVGAPPLSVRLDGSASTDPEGDPLTYNFSFGDGSADVSGALANVEHVYTAVGTFTARLTVSDGGSTSAAATRAIRVGQGSAPELELLSPGNDFRFAVRQNISLQVRATDEEDGVLPASAVTWTVTRHHDAHEHPYVPATHGKKLTVRGPAPEDLEATNDSWLVVRVRAVDSDGQETTLERALLPRKVRVTLKTDPAALRVKVNGTEFTPTAAGLELVSWAGWGLRVEAFAQNRGGVAYRFASWSDGGAAKHTFSTPARAVTLTARYRRR